MMARPKHYPQEEKECQSCASLPKTAFSARIPTTEAATINADLLAFIKS